MRRQLEERLQTVCRVPRLVIAMGGASGTMQAVVEALKSGCAVAVVKGSAGAAAAIASFMEQLRPQHVPRRRVPSAAHSSHGTGVSSAATAARPSAALATSTGCCRRVARGGCEPRTSRSATTARLLATCSGARPDGRAGLLTARPR